MNEEAMARVGPQRHRKIKKLGMKFLLVLSSQETTCHALSFVQRMPTPFIGLRGVVRLKVT